MPVPLTKPSESGSAVVIQLARLGDLVQSLPAIMALKERRLEQNLSLLCASPLSSVAACFPGLDRVIAWEGTRWRTWATNWPVSPKRTLDEVKRYLDTSVFGAYTRAYNLNQHKRAILLSALMADRVIGPGEHGPLDFKLPPWAAYVRAIAEDRGQNRIHLADAFCGFCGVVPLGVRPQVVCPPASLPNDLSAFGRQDGVWVALVVGAGDTARCMSVARWSEWIGTFLERQENGHVVLIGSGGERESARAIQDGLRPIVLGRVWDATGRTTLDQLIVLLARCHWVVGADTGPLHLAAATGARALGFYFARARVHETGPYGEGHWVFQANAGSVNEWPMDESVELILSDMRPRMHSGEWRVWQSHVDHWGAYYTDTQTTGPDPQRERIWHRLHRFSAQAVCS
ncbi:MAG: glycosyltransferase family 9 protein [Nitrospiraceae bacterium]